LTLGCCTSLFHLEQATGSHRSGKVLPRRLAAVASKLGSKRLHAGYWLSKKVLRDQQQASQYKNFQMTADDCLPSPDGTVPVASFAPTVPRQH
jgi:hypothetical protein